MTNVDTFSMTAGKDGETAMTTPRTIDGLELFSPARQGLLRRSRAALVS